MIRLVIAIVILLTGCSKKIQQEPVENSKVYYKNLEDFELDYSHSLQLDMNNDGVQDFAFASSIISEYLIEKLEFRAYTLHGSMILNNDVTPRVFDKSENITNTDAGIYSWTRNNAFIATRMYTADPATPAWDGAWKDKTNKYLAVKIKANNQFFTGWIRLSTGGIHSKIIIHDYAFSKMAETPIKAGEIN